MPNLTQSRRFVCLLTALLVAAATMIAAILLFVRSFRTPQASAFSIP